MSSLKYLSPLVRGSASGSGSASTKGKPGKGKEKGRSQRQSSQHDSDFDPFYNESNNYQYQPSVQSFGESEQGPGDSTQQYPANGWCDSEYGYEDDTYYRQQRQGASTVPDEADGFVLVEQGSTASSPDKQSRRRGKKTAEAQDTIAEEPTHLPNAGSEAPPYYHHYPSGAELLTHHALEANWRGLEDAAESSSAAMERLASGLSAVRLDRFSDDPDDPWRLPAGLHQHLEIEEEETPEVTEMPVQNSYYPEYIGDEYSGRGFATDAHTRVEYPQSFSEIEQPELSNSEHVENVLLRSGGGRQFWARALFDTGNKLGHHMVSLNIIQQLGLGMNHLNISPMMFYPVGSKHAVETLGGLRLDYYMASEGYGDFSSAIFQVMETLLQGCPYDVIICPEAGIQGSDTGFVAAMVLPRGKETPQERALRKQREEDQKRRVAEEKAERQAALKADSARRNAERAKKTSKR